MKKEKISNIKRLRVPGLIENMCQIIYMSDGSIGRDKLYQTLYNNGFKVYTYVFRIHYEAIAYKFLAYVRKGYGTPKEKKSEKVWAADFVKGIFISDYPGEIIHADIKYLMFESQWRYLHEVIETYANKVLAWEITKIRNSNSTINLEQMLLKNLVIHLECSTQIVVLNMQINILNRS